MKQQKSYYPKEADIKKGWQVVDASGEVLGRLASRVATIVRGRLKPEYTPSVDVGDYVVVINADKISVTGNKMEDKKYYRHSGYPGGLKEINLAELMKKDSCQVIYKAVWGMLPHNTLGRRLMTKVKIYSGPEHPHSAQLGNRKEQQVDKKEV
jgi:large subunit ribosomal protein L13